MSTLSRQIDNSSYEDGKIAIYMHCKEVAISHIEFWNAPDRSDNGFSSEARQKFINDAQKTISRCDAMIEHWEAVKRNIEAAHYIKEHFKVKRCSWCGSTEDCGVPECRHPSYKVAA